MINEAQEHNYPPPPSCDAQGPLPYPQQADYQRPSVQQQSYAAVARQGMQVKRQAQVAVDSWNTVPSNNALRMSQMQNRSDHAGSQARLGQRMPHAGHQTYAQAVRSPPARPPVEQYIARIEGQQYVQPQHLHNPTQYYTPSHLQWHHQVEQLQNQAWPATPTLTIQTVPNDITSNFNYRSGITETIESVGDWAGQPRAFHDRVNPRVDTHGLQLRAPSAHRYPASVTSASSSRVSTRRNKEQMISGDYNYRCDECQAGFHTNAELGQHMRKHVPYKDRPYPCDFCERRFGFRKDLRRHEPIHDPNAEMFPCPFSECKYSKPGFKREDHLGRHLRSQHRVDSVMQSSGSQSSFVAT